MVLFNCFYMTTNVFIVIATKWKSHSGCNKCKVICRIISIIHNRAAASTVNHGVLWHLCGSDDSGTYCVPANLACNLCHMSSRLFPIFPVCLFCQLSKTAEKTDRKNKQVQRSFKAGMITAISQANFFMYYYYNYWCFFWDGFIFGA